MTQTMQGSGSGSTNKITISRLELILLVLLVVLGMGTWVWVDRTVTTFLKPEEPREDRFRKQMNVQQLEAALLLNQEEQKATETQLIQARLDLVSHTASIDTFKQLYPQFAQLPALSITATLALSTSVPLEKIEQFVTARIAQETSQRLVDSLTQRLATLQTETGNLFASLQDAQQMADQQFYEAQATYLLKKPGLTLALSVLIMIPLVLVIMLIHKGSLQSRNAQKPTMFGSFVLLVASGLILILFGYQSFEIAGATFTGIIVLIVLLSRLPWSERETLRS